MKKVPAWVILCVIALVAGAALGTTNALTKGPIAEQAARAAEAARAAVLPAAERFEQVEVAEGAPAIRAWMHPGTLWAMLRRSQLPALAAPSRLPLA